jgi:hypothetical protein
MNQPRESFCKKRSDTKTREDENGRKYQQYWKSLQEMRDMERLHRGNISDSNSQEIT